MWQAEPEVTPGRSLCVQSSGVEDHLMPVSSSRRQCFSAGSGRGGRAQGGWAGSQAAWGELRSGGSRSAAATVAGSGGEERRRGGEVQRPPACTRRLQIGTHACPVPQPAPGPSRHALRTRGLEMVHHGPRANRSALLLGRGRWHRVPGCQDEQQPQQRQEQTAGALVHAHGAREAEPLGRAQCGMGSPEKPREACRDKPADA